MIPFDESLMLHPRFQVQRLLVLERKRFDFDHIYIVIRMCQIYSRVNILRIYYFVHADANTCGT